MTYEEYYKKVRDEFDHYWGKADSNEVASFFSKEEKSIKNNYQDYLNNVPGCTPEAVGYCLQLLF